MMVKEHSTTVAIITGSAGGLGKEFARRLLLEGAQVCLSDVNSKLGESTLEEFSTQFGENKVHFVACDVTSKEDWKKLWDEATSHFNGKQINLLVNNAGVMGEKEGWQKCIDINLMGVLHGSNLAMEKMKSGTVINVASILGLFCAKQPKGWAYNVSKSAVVTATRCMSSSESKVRMMCLCPSVTSTPILSGCTETELEEMKKQVGGFMSSESVGDAFMTLLSSGDAGSVMSLWKDCPPYYIPDTSMAQFILATTCAMIFRFIPAPTTVKPWPHMFFCLIAFLSFSIFSTGYIISFSYSKLNL